MIKKKKGQKSTQESQINALFKVIETEKKLITTSNCHVVRICQEKETKQFMAIFDGRIIIFQVYIFICLLIINNQ